MTDRNSGDQEQRPPHTFLWVTAVAFCVTGALLLGWDLVEHAYLSEISSEAIHRMHVVRGITTGVLVSVGIAWLLTRSHERYEAHMRVLQRELIRRERLAAVGELAGGVAHEIRNPLAGIGGALTMLAREIPADDDMIELMDEIQRQIRRMERLVADLLSYARPSRLHPEWIQINSILEQAAAAVGQLPNVPDARLALTLDPRVPDVHADPRELEHAFENLILNAFQAVTADGTITVTTRWDGARVGVEIRDDGEGIQDEIRNRIFDPFFTTKGRGTGLGLSLVQRAVEIHGGEITVHSKPAEGSTFSLTFPVEGGVMGDSAETQNGDLDR